MTRMPEGSIAYVELYVADAIAALEYLTGALGFTAHALAEMPDRYCLLVASGSARLIVTEPRGGGSVAEWLDAHGDGVRDIALYRPDLEHVVDRARAAGLPVQLAPGIDAATRILHARVGGFGSVQHTLLAPDSAVGVLPGFNWQVLCTIGEHTPPRLKQIDHVGVCLAAGELETTVATYRSVFDMSVRGSETATNGIVLSDDAGLTYVMVDPDRPNNRRPVEDFLTVHRGAGVGHLAFGTDDIAAAVHEYASRGVDLEPNPPAAYYQGLVASIGDAPQLVNKLADLQESGVRVDRDHRGERYHICTTGPHERETLRYELVERGGNRGFGVDNVIAMLTARGVDLTTRPDSGRAQSEWGTQHAVDFG